MTVILTPSITLNLGVDITQVKIVCESAYSKVTTSLNGDKEMSLFLQDVDEEYQIPSDFHNGSPFGVWEMISFEQRNWSDAMSVSEFKAYLESL